MVDSQNTVIDLNLDGSIDGWKDGNNNRWYCSSSDVIAHNSNVDSSAFSQFLIYSGIGFNSNAKSVNGDACCLSGTVVNTVFQTCECPSSSIETTFYSSDWTKQFSKSDKSCIACSSLIGSGESYNSIPISNFISGNSSSCQFTPFFAPIGSGNEFRCKSALANDNTAVYCALKCPDPSDQSACTK